jgi:hypothetical protein
VVKCRAGGTLTDVVVVVAVLGLLVCLSVPMLLTARDRSSRYYCSERLHQLGLSFKNYARDYGCYPSTRPSFGRTVVPDVSNSGYAAADPFGPDGPNANNVPAAAFLLLRTEKLNPDALICPGTDGAPERFGGLIPSRRSNFSDVQTNLTYSFQNLPASFVLAADRNPGDSAAITADSPAALLRLANSNSHGKAGQNVLYADGRVEFETSVFVGVDRDNIYTSRNNKTLDSPQDGKDTILLPAERAKATTSPQK